MESFFVNYAIPAAFILLAIAALAAIVLPLINSFSNPRALLRSAIGVIILIVVFMIGWSLTPAEANLQYDVTEGASKIIGGALTTMYILFGIAILGIIGSEIYKIVQ